MVLRFQVKKSSVIEAPANLAYKAISDYGQHHGNIIPPQFFGGMKVLKGSGLGEGTRIACTFKILRQADTLVMDVTEDVSGNVRIVQEIDTRAKYITRFLVEPLDDVSCKVTISTDVMRQPGWIAGAIDQWSGTALLGHIYREELKQLNKYAQTLR